MALSFIGANGQYLRQPTAVIGNSYPCSIACWIQMSAQTTVEWSIFTIGHASLSSAILLGVNPAGTTNGLLYGQVSVSGGSALQARGALPVLNTWTHLAMVVSGASSMTLYVNGVATSATGGPDTVAGMSNTLLGALQSGGAISHFFTGAVAYPSAWTVGLTSADVATLYNSGFGNDPRLVETSSLASFSFLQGTAPFTDSITQSNWTVNGIPQVVSDPFTIGSSQDARFGFATHFAQGWVVNPTMASIAATGVAWIRDDINAGNFETSPGVYIIPAFDGTWINAAHSNGLKICGILGPNGNYSNNYDPTAMANLSVFLVNNGLVDALEVLNEPNNAYQTYVGSSWETLLPILTTTVANAVNAVSSTVPVIGLGAQGSQIITMLPSTTMNGVDYHPYDSGNFIPETVFEPPYGAYNTWIAALRTATTLPLWETEWGSDTGVVHTQVMQAGYIARRMLQSSGLAVEHSFIYEFKDNNSSDTFGVCDINYVPKTAYGTVTNIISALMGAVGTPSSAVTITSVGNGDTTDVYAYSYQGIGTTIVSYWFGNHANTASPPASTVNLNFQIFNTFPYAVLFDPISGTTTPLSNYNPVFTPGSLNVSGLPISDHPQIIITASTFPNAGGVSLFGIPSGETFGAMSVKATGTATASLTGVPSAQAFGHMSVADPSTIQLTGIPSGQAFGIITVLAPISPIQLFGIPSGQAFGTLTAHQPPLGSVPQLVQSNHNVSISGNTGSIPFVTANITLGDFIVVAAIVAVPTNFPSVTDSAGNVYNLAITNLDSGSTTVTIWYAPVTQGGGTKPTVNILTTGTSNVYAFIWEFTSVNNANPIDAPATSSGTGSTGLTANSGSLFTDFTSDVLASVCICASAITTPTAGWTATQALGFTRGYAEVLIAGGPSSYAATYTQTSVGEYNAAIASFSPQGLTPITMARVL